MPIPAEELHVGEREVRAGDTVTDYHYGDGYWVYATAPIIRHIAAVDEIGLRREDGGYFHHFGAVQSITFKVLRPIGSTTSAVPSAQKVKDWPIVCPKCRKAESAVLLFQTYDCKHGCYR